MTLPPPLTPGDLLAAYAIVHVRARTAPDLQGLAQRLIRPEFWPTGSPTTPTSATSAAARALDRERARTARLLTLLEYRNRAIDDLRAEWVPPTDTDHDIARRRAALWEAP